MNRKVSTRMCIACRRRERPALLLRIIWRAGSIALDSGGQRSGRSTYVHRSLDCVSKVGELKRLAQAFRQPLGAIRRDEVAVLGAELRSVVERHEGDMRGYGYVEN